MATAPSAPPSQEPRAFALRLGVGFVAGWLVLDRTAAMTGSVLGQTGLLVGAVTVAALLALDALLFQASPQDKWRAIGLGRPAARGIVVALAVSALMLGYFPVYAAATGATLPLRDDWARLAPGLLAQAGIAEEVLFRGFVFGHLRRTRLFWRAALLSMPLFVLVHLPLFGTMDPAIAAAATVLALGSSFPLARLYDLAGGTAWAPAIAHAVMQGAIKVVVAPADAGVGFGVGWMAVCLVVPWLAFAVRPRAAGAAPVPR